MKGFIYKRVSIAVGDVVGTKLVSCELPLSLDCVDAIYGVYLLNEGFLWCWMLE